MSVVEFLDSPEVVRSEGLGKRFVVRKDNSVKERVISLGRTGRRHRQDFWALKDIDLSIHAGTTIGLIGHNGSGKSTLLKLLGGIIEPTLGTVERRGRLAALIELGAGFHPDLTGRENVYLNAALLGLSQAETDAQFNAILEFAEIGEFIDTQVKFYSSGMYVRLAFSVAIHTDPDVLLVDEVLAVGDEGFQRKCMDKIREFQEEGRTIILVTHSLSQVTELCNRAVLLDHGVVLYDGNPLEAVRRFRAVMDERSGSSAISLTEFTQPTSPTHVALVSASAIGRLAEDAMQSGDDLAINVTVASHLGAAPWKLGFQILLTTSGQGVVGTSSDLLGITMPQFDGEQQFRFTLASPALGAARYAVVVAVLDAAGRIMHEYPHEVQFEVISRAKTTGVLSSDVRLEGGGLTP